MKASSVNWSNRGKVEARQTSVIVAFRDATVLRSVPPDRQYWSLCGQLFDSAGRLKRGSEFEHVVSHGLLVPAQFHGVEMDREIHDGNQRALPGVTFHFGEFSNVVYAALRRGAFQPALINLDTTNEPERAIELLNNVMDATNYCDGPVVLVFNMILWCRRTTGNRRYTWDSVTSMLGSSRRFGMVYRHGWSQVPGNPIYEYNGTRATKMGTVVFIRKGPALCST